MEVYKLTIEQKNLLIGMTYDGYSYFNPVQDANDNWVIGLEEKNSNVFNWLKDIPLIDFSPKITEEI